MVHIILYQNVDLHGDHLHLFSAQSFLGTAWNDMVSSFQIVEGNWEFFADVNFANQMGGPGKKLGPGFYHWIEDALGPGTNDKLTSLRPV